MAARKKFGWGVCPGAGRSKGSGSGPKPNARKNRVAIMLTDSELKKRNRLAARKKAPLATLAYELMAKGLKTSAERPRLLVAPAHACDRAGWGVGHGRVQE